jgi:hypothetical protein
MKLFFALLLSLTTISAIAQIKKTVLVARKYNSPVVIIDTFQTTFRTLILDSSGIKKTRKITIPSTSLHCSSYDIVIIEPKDNIQLVRLDKVFDFFKIPAEDRKLKICINNILINNPSTILANINDIKNVEITDYIYSLDLSSENKGVKYLNINI